MYLKKIIKYSEYLLLFILLASLIILYFNNQWNILYNSDTLALAELMQHLAHNKKFMDWGFPTTPMYFPEWATYFLSFILSKNVYFQLLIYSILNTLLLYIPTRMIYGEFFSKNKTIVFALTSISLFLLLATNIIAPYVLLLVPAQHVGTFIIGLFYLYIQLRLLKNSLNNVNKLLIISLIILVLLMGISDLLFIIEFIFPIFIVHGLMYLKKRVLLKNLIIFSLLPLLISILGVWLIPYIIPKTILWAYLDHPSISKISIVNVIERLDFIKSSFIGIVYSYPILIYVYSSFYITTIILSFSSLFNFASNQSFRKLQENRNFFICQFFIISIFVNIAAFLVLPSQVVSAQRYIEPVFFIPIIFYFVIFSFLTKRKFLKKILFISSLIILTYLTYKNIVTFFKKIYTAKTYYYTKELECIDNAVDAQGSYGISDYWTTRPVSLFSKKNLIMHAFNENLTPFLISTDVGEFRNKYTFAIIHKSFDIEKMLKLSGHNPNKIVTCNNKKIFIFSKNTLKVACFTKKGFQYTWPAASLPSRFSSSAEKNFRRVKEVDGENFLSFGPYILLPEGHYFFYIRYSSRNAISEQVGTYDVYDINRGILFQKPMFGTNNEVKTLDGNFIVNEAQSYSIPFEIRIYFMGKGELNLESITLERVK